MQILEPPSTTTYQTEQGHIIETFLFSTKPNDADFQISKSLGHKLAEDSVGHDFIIVPELIFKPIKQGGGGHIWDWHTDEYKDILQGYANHSHGKIIEKKGPYYYGDGTDDYFYLGNVKLNNSKAAAALLEYGPKTWTKYAVSPHIYPLKQNNGLVEDAKFIGLSLVIKGAYGDQAVVTKYCKGEDHVCYKSLAGSTLCDKEDSLAASIISSLVTNDENKNIMSQVQVPQVQEIKQIPTTQPVEEKKDNPELEALKKQLEEAQNAAKEKEETVTKLLNKDKTNTLNKIFGDVKDDSIRKTLVDKYLPQDTDILNDFYQDVSTHVFPSLVEAAKVQAENELKNKVIEENKSKSKAGSLPAEPSKQEEIKNIVPNNENQVLKFDRLMRGLS